MRHLTLKSLGAALLLVVAAAYAHLHPGEYVGLAIFVIAALVLFGAHVQASATTKLGTVSVDVADGEEEAKP